MVKDLKQEIGLSFEKIFIKDIDSTQTYLLNLIKSKKLNEKIAIYSNKQSQGIGSRGNKWDSKEGNLYLSFAIPLVDLPNDLKLSSSSIYFVYLAKLVFLKFGKEAWVKWPNDLYKDDKKMGGAITSKVDDMLVCGIGVNFKSPPIGAFGYDDVDIDAFLDDYLDLINTKIMWKEIFKQYLQDFEKSRNFYFNLGNKKVSLEDAFLYQDGSILLENQRIYSLR